MSRYVKAIPGRKNNYRHYHNETKQSADKRRSDGSRAPTKSVTNSKEFTRVSARLTVTSAMLKAGDKYSEAERQLLFQQLELEDDCFEPKLLKKILKAEREMISGLTGIH